MGWASAGEIFDPVAQALIDCGADEQTKRRVLGMLIGKLQDGDWDTEDESMRQFRHDPVIAELFRKAGVGDDLYTAGVYGELEFHGDEWVLSCDEHGELDRADDDAAGHDSLVLVWVGHCRDRHGGDGQVHPDMLINPESVAT
jgi:hypothetical protein